MPLSTDVNLPKDHQTRFPDKCVVCGCPSPGSTVRLITGAIGWWTWLLWHFGKPFSVVAPACRKCAWRLHGRRFASLLLTVALCVVALELVWPLVAGSVSRGLRNLAMMGLALICLAPLILYEAFFPHPFNITAYRESVDYEFRDPERAREFAELNRDAAWVEFR